MASSQDWPQAAAEAAGLSAAGIAELDRQIADGGLPGLHGLVVIRGGKLVLERYLSGPDQSWGTNLGERTFGPDEIHDLRSVSKSIVALLYGIALTDGAVPGLDASLYQQFPEFPDLAGDPKRAAITIDHVLTMSMGLVWDETRPYDDPLNDEIQMIFSADPLRFALAREVISPPGRVWHYSGGATTILGALIARGTGQRLLDYATAKLFAPLGIDQVEWARLPSGVESAASGLRLTPRDLARIGQLVLNGGHWAGRQLVPEDWIRQIVDVQIETTDGLGYGRHWYVGHSMAWGWPWYAAFGNGGQRLFVAPHHDLVLAVTAGNYNKPDASQTPVFATRAVLKALK